MKCIGYSQYEGKYQNYADKTTSPSGYWCKQCEKLLRETITRQMEELLREFSEEEQK